MGSASEHTNAERVAYALGEKARADLSIKTSANNFDAARDNLLNAVAALTWERSHIEGRFPCVRG
jgi:hypothetical protein